MKLKLLAILVLSGFCSVAQTIVPRFTKPEKPAYKVYVMFANGREQYAVKVDSAFYFIRYDRLVPVKKEVKQFRYVK